MASINKLSIRGVRSFSPDEKEQVIEFFYPVTVIVGANGCGKTTIIESLKYAVTGSLPPGNKSGQAFVHDPKSAGQSVVKANIKLRFTNRAGTSMVVSRSMEVQQKKTTLSFKALDGVLRTTDPETGERISMSHKCTELDRQIPTLMGVSKPILEHVVFCHQEDSSWPLMEGAILKKRFDDIFDSTRYAKALEAIRSTSKEYTAVAKDLKAELSGLSSHKHAAKGFRQELDHHNSQIEELEEEILACKNELKDVEAEMRRAREITDKVGSANEDLEDKRTELEREQTKAATQLSMLQENLTEKHTLRELKEMLSDFDEQMAGQVQRKQDMENEAQALRNRIESYRQEEMQLQGHIGKLEAEREAHEKILRERLRTMEQIAQTYGIDLPVTQTQADLTSTQDTEGDETTAGGTQTTTTGGGTQTSNITIAEEDMRAFYQALEAKEKELEEQLRRYREESQAAEDQLQVVLGDLMGKEKSIENDRQKLSDQRMEARNEIETLSSAISSRGTRVRKSEIEELKRVVTKIAQDREKLNSDPRKGEIPLKIRNFEVKIDKLKREIEDDSLVLQELRHNAEAQQAIVVLEEQAAKQLEDLREVVNEEDARFRTYNLPSPTSLAGLKGDGNDDELVNSIHEWAKVVEDKYNAAKSDLEKAAAEEQTVQKRVSESTALLGHNRRRLQKLQGRIRTLDGSMKSFRQIVKDFKALERELGESVSISDDVSPQEFLETLTEQIEEASSAEVKPAAIRKIMYRLIRLVAVNNDDGTTHYICPCCDRGMDENDREVMQTAMTKLMDVETSPLFQATNVAKAEKVRARLEKHQGWRTEISNKMQDLLECSRVQDEFAALNTSVNELEEELETKKDTLENAKGKRKEIEKETTDLRSLVDLSRRWCEEAGRISEKRLQISSKHETSMSMSMSVPDTSGRDMKTVERDLDEKREEKESMMNKIARLNKEMSQLNTDIAQLALRGDKHEKLLKEKEERYAREQEATVKRAALTEKIEELDEEDKKLEALVAPIRQKIREKEVKKQIARDQAKCEESQLSKSLSLFKSDIDGLKALTTQIERYTKANKEDELQRLKSKISKLNENADSKEAELKVLLPKLEKFSKSVDDQERHKKTIEDNIKQFGLKQSIDRLMQEVSELEDEIEKIEGADTCDKDYRRADKRRTEILDTKARHEGRRGGIVDNIRALKRKLQTAEYKDIDERHRITMIKHETTQIAVGDLDKYYTALDKALMRYHGLKIADINKIIRELWSLTYKGEDITNIELVSGQDTGSRAKRSYNYRVVMTKGNTKLDMRGRCSAGQRVLACIVIRLALAETFCLNCGVIALDEPTVNLDYENKRGLAIALAQIIALRAQQNNFQLITITHDEDFVVMMKTELATHSGFDMPDRYFHVRREEGHDGKYYSKINAIDWDELA